MTSVEVAEYEVLVSHDGSGDFDGEYDNVTDDVRVPPSSGGREVTISRGRSGSRSSDGARPPTADWVQGNESRRYSSQAGDSPLFGQLLPGRPCVVQGTLGDPDIALDDPVIRLDDPFTLVGGEATIRLFTGRTNLPDEDPSLGNQFVSMSATGRMQQLLTSEITTPLYTSITVGVAFQHLFTAMGWVEDVDYTIDPELVLNGRLLAYWHATARVAFDAGAQLIATEGAPAVWYERGDGLIAVEGRNYRNLNGRSRTALATFRDLVTDGDLYHTRFRTQSGLLDIINRAAFDVVVRAAAGSPSDIWTYGSTLTISAAGTAIVTARPDELFVDAIVPVVTTDFTLSGGSASVALSRTSGGATTISFSGGTPGATITGLKLRAKLFAKVGTFRAESRVDAGASIATYGLSSWKPVIPVWDGLATAEADSLCDALVLAYQQPRPTVEFDIANADMAHLLSIFQAEVSNRYHVVDRHSGANYDVIAETFKHRIGGGGQHVLTVGAERAFEQDPGIWDDEGSVWNLALWGN